ncbi:MAG: hypothetical protein JJ911_01375 [Rhizobiaceae bacterium]|nr:hypothetical protein [Rhizobiaceae bacterium]
MMTLANWIAAAIAVGMAASLLRPSLAGWHTKLGASIHAAAALALLWLALAAVFPIGGVR